MLCVIMRLCEAVRVFSYMRMCGDVCLCAHLTTQSHASVTSSQLCCSRKAERVCGGEIRTARLLQGLALPAQHQTQVRQTSFDVSTE